MGRASLPVPYVKDADQQQNNDFIAEFLIDDPWVVIGGANAPAFVNGWSNYGSTYETAAFYRDTKGVIHLRGVIKGGTGGVPAFVLPGVLIPPRRLIFGVIADSAMGRVDVWSLQEGTPGGVVPSGAYGFVSLEGLSFRP